MSHAHAAALALSLSLAGLAALSSAVACKGSPEPSASAASPGSVGGSATPAPATDPNARRVDITASEKGYSPSSIPAKKGESLTLRFTRTTESECLSAVEFPDLKIKRDLPVNKPVDIPIRAEKTGDIKFQCGMAMLFGKIVVE